MERRKAVRRGLGLSLAWGMVACASGTGPELTSQAFDDGVMPMTSEGDETGSITTSGLGTGTEGADSTSEGGSPDLGACQSDADCVLPVGLCLETQGHCDGGVCEHGAAAPGAGCDDGDPCTVSDACDGEGMCFGVPLDCGPGMCVNGECIDEGCPPGFADCNEDVGDGCEVELGTDTDCGGCGDACLAGANASGSCSAGACQYQCQAPYDNCDGDWTNGCEIPVGVPHMCDAQGINPTTGCWTAYCGNSNSSEATNFGTFHCMDCATCRSPVAGECQWCDHTSGEFYPADVCGCGNYEDLACN